MQAQEENTSWVLNLQKKDLTLQAAGKTGQSTCQEKSYLCFLGKLKKTSIIFHVSTPQA